jgi:hypothetical protein
VARRDFSCSTAGFFLLRGGIFFTTKHACYGWW